MARWLTVVAAAVLFGNCLARTQAQDRLPPPTPIPSVPVPPAPPPAPPPPPAYFSESVPLDEPRPYGWFTGIDLGVAFLHMRDFTDFATADPSATVAWAWQLGYRFDTGSALRFTAAGVNSEGSGDGWDSLLGPVRATSSIDNFYCDLDYVSRRYGSPDAWSMQWHAGLRFSSMELKTLITDGVIAGQGTNQFGGAGLHLGLEVQRALGTGGWALFGKFDGGAVWGDAEQTIEASVGTFSAGVETEGPESVPMIQMQAGLRWEPLAMPWFRFSTGYQYEQWWVNADGENPEEAFFQKLGFTSHGPFLRCEFGY
ncbi:MAG: hypothetical protein JNM56_32640 [Planctomycetia bacterium]|nr:hypothetical protein [Planctomycetia bacterium]